jgi:hypothetical protein
VANWSTNDEKIKKCRKDIRENKGRTQEKCRKNKGNSQ